MTLTTATNSGGVILRPEQVDQMLVRPALAASAAAQTTRLIQSSAPTFTVPMVTADPSAAWVAEGAEITPSDATFNEVTATPSKLAGLSIITRELADDTSPAAAEAVGEGLARDIARKVDAAFYSTVAAPAPAGLTTLSGIQTVINANVFTNADAFAEAQSLIETQGGICSAFVAAPATVLTLAKVKEATGSNKALLQPDPTQPTRRMIGGVPLIACPSVAANTVWAYDGTRIILFLRDGTRIEADRSVFFTSDRVAVKATLRIGFGFAHPATVVKIATA